MRRNSTTWTVTCHPFSSARSTPSTASIGRPSSAGKSERTSSTASRADSRRFPEPFLRLLPRCSAIRVLLPQLVVGDRPRLRVFAALTRLRHREPLEQVVFHPLALLLAEVALLGLDLELDQLGADAVLVVELPVGLLGHLPGDPRDPAYRRERERQQPGEQTHAVPPPLVTLSVSISLPPRCLARRTSAE